MPMSLTAVRKKDSDGLPTISAFTSQAYCKKAKTIFKNINLSFFHFKKAHILIEHIPEYYIYVFNHFYCKDYDIIRS